MDMNSEKYHVYEPAQSADPAPGSPPHSLSLGSLGQREGACPAPPIFLETNLDLEASPEERGLVTNTAGNKGVSGSKDAW